MEDSILNFNKQFDWKPEVKNPRSPWQGEHIALCGMGGSHLSGGLLKLYIPDLPIIIHRDYGLPPLRDIEESFLIASSYSGNTEETIDFLNSALGKGLKPAIIASGGKLLEIAEANNLPYVKMPDTVIQPRVALGYSLLALAKILGMEELARELGTYRDMISPEVFMEEGKIISEKLFKKNVLVFASNKNKEISYNWKIKINETAKVPAYANVIPEMNHNEIAAFGNHKGTPHIESCAVFIEDDTDSGRNKKRMEITGEILSERGTSVLKVSLRGENPLLRALQSLVLADWTALYLARLARVDADTVPVIADFKQRMK